MRSKFTKWSHILPLVYSLFIGNLSVAQDLAPDFSGVDMRIERHSEKPITLSDYRGKVVFIDFWASWCPPCLLSLPAYEAMRAQIGGDDFEIIAINVDENPEDGLLFLEDNPVSYSVLADPTGEIGIPYRVRSLPAAYLIDREGRIVNSYRNFKAGDEVSLKLEIESLIRQ